ncbi:MAG: POTRA domain-containing protein [Acidobacteriota bacterium]
MKFCKFSLSVFVIFFAFNFVGIRAQNLNSPQKILLSKANSLPFKEGETVIAEVRFEGLDSDYEHYDSSIGKPIYASTFLRILRESKAGIAADEKFNTQKTEKIIKLLKEWLANIGYLKAEVVALGEKLPKNRMNLIFSVKRDAVVRVLEIRFVGNINSTNEELVEVMKQCLEESWINFDKRYYEYCANKNLRNFMFSKGYFKSKIEQISPRFVDDYYVVTIKVEEGIRYRFGEIEIKGAKIFTEKEILEMLKLKTGDIADGKTLVNFFNEKLKEVYWDKGYVLYNAEFDVEYIEPITEGLDGIVSIKGVVDEGKAFKIRKIEFVGVEKEKAQKLRKILALNEGEIYNQSKFKDGIRKINETKDFSFIDDEQDIEVLSDEETNNLDFVIKVKKVS